jgi:signal transduction histidine kinase
MYGAGPAPHPPRPGEGVARERTGWLLGDLCRRRGGDEQAQQPAETLSEHGVGIAASAREARPREATGRFIAMLVLALVQFGAVQRTGWHGVGLLAGIVSVLCMLGWACWVLGWALPWRRSPYLAFAGLLVMGTGGALLTGLLQKDVGVTPVFPAMACVVISSRWPTGRAAVVVGWLLAVLLASSASEGWHQFATSGLGYGGLFVGMYGLGVGRRSYILRAQSAEQLLKETERANHEQAHAAALAERGRIAREIHDVLAHSLAALTVQLEAADALLEAGGETGVAKAHGYVQKSRRIAREGLIETRRAIAALREDSPPLPELLYALADAYRGDTGAPAEVRVEGLPRPMPADAGLTVYRAAQESLTNVRKHAPGAPVWLAMVFGDEEITLTVANGAATEPPNALADSGGGYGLAGLKERAELIGGTLEAGPRSAGPAGPGQAGPGPAGPERAGLSGDGWQVTLRLRG